MESPIQLDHKISDLPVALASKAERELNEIAEKRADDIRALREAVTNQPDLKSRIDDNFLLRFLRAKKFDQKRALESLRNYYKQRIKYPDFFGGMSVSSISPVLLEKPLLGTLPDKDPEGRAICIINEIRNWKPSAVHIDDVGRYCFLSLELLIEDEETQINGIVVLINALGFGLEHLMASTPLRLAKYVSVSYGSFPARFKEIHVIHAPIYFRIMHALVKPFLSEKIRGRFHFHGHDLTDFHRRIPPEMLPEEFGGLRGPFANKDWNRQLDAHQRVMEWSSRFGFQSGQ